MDYKLIKNITTYHLPLLFRGNMAAHNSYFLSKLKPNPKGVGIDLTNNCCLRCVMCNAWRRKSINELTLEEVVYILDQLKLEGFTSLSLSGGEALLRNDILEIIKYANELDFKITLFTNGYLVNEEIATNLVENGVSSISVSLDGLGEKYDKIRGVKGAHEKVYNSIKIFSMLAKRKKLKSFSVSAMIMKPTINTIPDVINFCINMGIPISFNLPEYTSYLFQNVPQKNLWIGENDMVDLNRIVDRMIEIKKEHPKVISENYISLEYIRNYFIDPIRKDVPCFYILKNILIDSHGKVYPCAAVSPIGDLRKEKLSSILKSENYIRKVQNLFKKECPGCSCSYNINLRYNLPSLIMENFSRSIS